VYRGIIRDVSAAEIKPVQYAGEVFFAAVGKIVNAADFFSLRHQGMRDIGANKAGNAGDQVFGHRTSIAFRMVTFAAG